MEKHYYEAQDNNRNSEVLVPTIEVDRPATPPPAYSTLPEQTRSLNLAGTSHSHSSNPGHPRHRSLSVHSDVSTASDSSYSSSSSSDSSSSSSSSDPSHSTRRSKKSGKSKSHIKSVSSLTGVPRTPGPPDLTKPIAIPAASSKLGSPFLRAYSPNLESYNISQEVFLKFLDDLNRVATKSPPLRVLGLSGRVMGFVPVFPVDVVGHSVELAAGLGAAAISKGRTEMQLREANRTIFGPRGLKVQVAKVDALAQIAGMPILDSNGKIKEGAKIMSKVDSHALDKWERRNINAQQRRLDALSEYIAPLDVTPLPEISTPSNPLSRWAASASEKDRRKQERRMDKQARKSERKQRKNEGRAERRLEKREAKHERKLEKVISKHGEGSSRHQRLESRWEERQSKMGDKYDRDVEKSERRKKKDSREEKSMKKILWLVIRRVEDGEKEGEELQKDQMEDFTGPAELEGEKQSKQ